MSKDTEWKNYATKTLTRFLASIPKEEINLAEYEKINTDEICQMSQSDAYKTLRSCISTKQVSKYQNNFHQHQYRKKNETTTLPLKAQSLKRLQAFQHQMAADSIDEAIEFLLSPEYEDYRADVEIAKYMMAKQGFEQKDSFYKTLFKWLPKYELGRIELIIESVFQDGWKKAKASRKRTGNPMNEALDENTIYQEIKKRAE